jgi:hypothetical protein
MVKVCTTSNIKQYKSLHLSTLRFLLTFRSSDEHLFHILDAVLLITLISASGNLSLIRPYKNINN